MPIRRSGGRQPAVVELAFATVTRFCALLTFRTAHSFPVPRLAHASRSWLHGVCSLHKEPSAMQKRTFAGAAGVSPPWVELAFATVTGFCALLTFRTAHSFPVPRLTDASRSPWHARMPAKACVLHPQRSCVSHGWLTPAALGCTACVRCIKSHPRCRNAHSQERRASARRGCE
jgi:uncharacterized membrane protein YhaH (DUF805 family)